MELFKKKKRHGLVGPLIALTVAIIVAVAVAIPVTIQVISGTNFTGYDTTQTVVQLFPLLIAVLVLTGIAGYMYMKQ